MSLTFAIRRFTEGPRMRFTSIDDDCDLTALWMPKKDELSEWKDLLHYARRGKRMTIESAHEDFEPYVEIEVGREITVTAFHYEHADNFYEDSFSETITLKEFEKFATAFIAELEK